MDNAKQSAFPLSSDVLEMCGEKPSPFGLTKREYFAAMALQSLIRNYPKEVYEHCQDPQHIYYTGLSAVACDLADTLLKTLEK